MAPGTRPAVRVQGPLRLLVVRSGEPDRPRAGRGHCPGLAADVSRSAPRPGPGQVSLAVVHCPGCGCATLSSRLRRARLASCGLGALGQPRSIGSGGAHSVRRLDARPAFPLDPVLPHLLRVPFAGLGLRQAAGRLRSCRLGVSPPVCMGLLPFLHAQGRGHDGGPPRFPVALVRSWSGTSHRRRHGAGPAVCRPRRSRLHGRALLHRPIRAHGGPPDRYGQRLERVPAPET